METNKTIIAGPCSVESREQLFETCDQLVENGITFIRGGVWKPRTKPGGFEGLGEIALKWMLEYKTEHSGVKMCCEVANEEQVKLALQYKMDAIWIGARTTSDPFAVQEIAEAIAKIDNTTMVMVKNPSCVDIDLWEGAYLRLLAMGINNVAFIHRGFKAYKDTDYRNNPLWQYALQMKLKYRDVSMLCDPSHIAGKREYVEEICQKACMYGYDGFIIESHCNPDMAWTDASQQLKPSDLNEMLHRVLVMEQNTNEVMLKKYRDDVDSIDRQILELVKSRFEVTNKIGELKKESNMPVFQPERFIQLVQSLKDMKKIPDTLVEAIWGAIHEESVNEQNSIIEERDEK